MRLEEAPTSGVLWREQVKNYVRARESKSFRGSPFVPPPMAVDRAKTFFEKPCEHFRPRIANAAYAADQLASAQAQRAWLPGAQLVNPNLKRCRPD